MWFQFFSLQISIAYSKFLYSKKYLFMLAFLESRLSFSILKQIIQMPSSQEKNSNVYSSFAVPISVMITHKLH